MTVAILFGSPEAQKIARETRRMELEAEQDRQDLVDAGLDPDAAPSLSDWRLYKVEATRMVTQPVMMVVAARTPDEAVTVAEAADSHDWLDNGFGDEEIEDARCWERCPGVPHPSLVRDAAQALSVRLPRAMLTDDRQPAMWPVAGP